MKKLLLIEDDAHLTELLVLDAQELGFEIDTASSGAEGLTKALNNEYSLILLDLHLPDLDGIEICKRVRQKNESVPIIVLTARADDVSKVLLIELGADDYLTKPYNNLELRARIKAVMRRSDSSRNAASADTEAEVFEYGDLKIDFEKRRVSVKGVVVDLTARQYDIITTLASRPGRPFSRSELCTAVYGHEVVGYDVSVSSHINRLRAKIEPNPEEPIYVLTVRGVGYCLSDSADVLSSDKSDD